MAKVDKITGENIEKFRGIIDFYMLRGRLPVARSWPQKPKPPYTALQAEAMAVFGIAASSLSRISTNMLEEWRKGTIGVRPQWTDIFKGIIMSYWKINKNIAAIALDYKIIETVTQFRISWDILQLYIDPIIPEEIYTLQTNLINKSDLEKTPKPIYFTLLDDNKNRLVAPYILFEIIT
jgi:hypothetical protein